MNETILAGSRTRETQVMSTAGTSQIAMRRRGRGGRGRGRRPPRPSSLDAEGSRSSDVATTIATPQQTHINDLPDESIAEIFSRVGDTTIPIRTNRRPNYLTAPLYTPVVHPLQCAFVCRRWRACAPAAVHSLSLRHVQRSVAIAEVKKRFGPTLTRARIAQCPLLEMVPGTRFGRSTLADFAEAVPNLESLEIDRMLTKYGEWRHIQPHSWAKEHYASGLTLFPKLRKLRIGAGSENDERLGGLWKTLSEMTGLVELSIALPEGTAVAACEALGRNASITALHVQCHEPPPDALARLSALQSLFVQCGEVDPPLAVLGQLTTLQSLEIRFCPQLTALPDTTAAASASHLRKLSIYDCPSLACLPNSLCSLTALTDLEIVNCRSLRTLPAAITDLRSLSKVHVAGCDSLSALPKSIGAMSWLQSLTIERLPNLSFLPFSFARLAALRVLRVTDCCRMGKLPGGIRGLERLRELYVVGSPEGSFVEIEGSLQGLSSLRKLHLSRAGCTSGLPAGVCRLSTLQVLEIGSLPLAFLPKTLCELTSLRELRLSGLPNLSLLPRSLVELPALEVLDLSDCSLQKLPFDLGNLQSLRKLRLVDTNVEKGLPKSTAALSRLEVLDLRGDSNIGSVPASVLRLPALRHVHCEPSKLRGGVPRGVVHSDSESSFGGGQSEFDEWNDGTWGSYVDRYGRERDEIEIEEENEEFPGDYDDSEEYDDEDMLDALLMFDSDDEKLAYTMGHLDNYGMDYDDIW